MSQASNQSEASVPGSAVVTSTQEPEGAWPEGFQRTGRFAVVEDLSAVGCDRVLSLLQGRGLVGLFGQTAEELSQVEAAVRAAGGDVRSRQWALFHLRFGSGPGADQTCAEGLRPEGMSHHPLASLRWLNASQVDQALRTQARDLMTLCGVDPPEEYLLEEGSGSEFLCALDSAGECVSTGTVLPVHRPRGPWSGYAQLGTLAVRPDGRRTGLGLELSRRLIAAAQVRQDIMGLTAVAADDNPASQGLLMRLGFKRDAERHCRIYFRGDAKTTR